jgi:hypothetical protein
VCVVPVVRAMPLDLLSRIDVSSYCMYSSCVVVGGTAVTVTLSDYIAVDKLIY